MFSADRRFCTPGVPTAPLSSSTRGFFGVFISRWIYFILGELKMFVLMLGFSVKISNIRVVSRGATDVVSEGSKKN